MSNTERLEQIQGDINAYKSLLRDTDYSLYKLVENIAGCNSFDDLKSACASYLDKYGATVEKRREWRSRINDLEAEAENLEPDFPEEETVPEEPEAEPVPEQTEDATPSEGESQEEPPADDEEIIVDDPEAEPDDE